MTATIHSRPTGAAARYGATARRDATVRTGVTTAFWAGLALLVFWWTAGGGLADLGAVDTALTSVGRITGLVASYLLLVQVLLMARLPVLENLFGRDDLVRTHRLVGMSSITLLAAHVVLITWGYAGGRLVALVGEFWSLTVDYPGMLLAVAGTVALVVVAATSARRARAKLRYESWHLLHLYAYLGVGLALPHQLWTGADFTSSAAATVFWWTLWIAAAGAIIGWRVLLPLWRSARHRLRVTAVVPEADGVTSVYLSGRDLHRLPVRAGQFLNWRFLGRSGWTRANPYSLSAAPNGAGLRITVRSSGDGSASVASLRAGTPVLVEGPYGRLTGRARTTGRVALIGAGVGIAPLRALADELAYSPGDAVVLQRCAGAPLFAGEFATLAATRGLDVRTLGGHRRADGSWLGTHAPPLDDRAVLLALVPDIATRDVYVCGPPAWIEAVCRAARAAGVPESRLHVERFGW